MKIKGEQSKEEKLINKFIKIKKIYSSCKEKDFKKSDFTFVTGINNLKKSEMLDLILGQIKKNEKIKQNKPKQYYQFMDYGKYSRIAAIKKKSKENFEKLYDEARKINDIEKKLNFKQVQYFKFGEYLLKTDYDEKCDWDYYPKSYKYPKKEIYNRRVEFHKYTSKGYENTKVGEIKIKRFQGNFIFNAIVNFFSLYPIEVDKNLKNVQLNKYFEIQQIKKIADITVFKRFLANNFYDYCVVKNGITYHHENLKIAFSKLKDKIKNPDCEDIEEIDYQKCKKLGFCDTGINQFCDDNDIDINDSYSKKALQKIIDQKKSINQKYSSELRKLKLKI